MDLALPQFLIELPLIAVPAESHYLKQNEKRRLPN
jgi:hypothetical protein